MKGAATGVVLGQHSAGQYASEQIDARRTEAPARALPIVLRSSISSKCWHPAEALSNPRRRKPARAAPPWVRAVAC